MTPYLSVIVPAYNEETNIKKGVLNEILAFINKQEYTFELLVIDDGSTDKTFDLLTDKLENMSNCKAIKDVHNGKAFTLLRGVQEALGEIILMMDMDQATPISEINKLLPYFNQDFDIVIGSRGSKRKNAPLGRKLLSFGQMFLRNFILGFKNIHDTQCGFKAYKNNVIKEISDNLHIYSLKNAKEIEFPSVAAGFDIEVLFVATKLGYKIKEVEVIWDYKMSRRVNLLNDAIRGFKELLLLRYLQLIGRYGF